MKLRKTLCSLGRKQIEENIGDLSEIICNPKFICCKCARVSNKKKYLCKPSKLKQKKK
jgi:hypothetical protein